MYKVHAPQLGTGVFVAPDATVIGRVTLGAHSSIWYGCVVRGDVEAIQIGARTNIQDLSVIHVTGEGFPTHVGDDVTVGHRAILHGCTIGDHVLVGMGAIVLDGAIVESHSLIGAGALVAPGTHIPSGVLALGAPARVVRALSAKEQQNIASSGAHYVELAAEHARMLGRWR